MGNLVQKIAIIAISTVYITACNSSTSPIARVIPSPSVSPTSQFSVTKDTPVDQLPNFISGPWITRDATIVPPNGFLKTISFNITVQNHTSGAVSDKDAAKWGEGAVRNILWEEWADKNLQLNFLSTNLADNASSGHIYTDDRAFIQKALDVHGALKVHLLVPISLSLIKVADKTNQTIAALGENPSTYAFIITSKGPQNITLNYPDGHSEILDSHSSSETFQNFIGGLYKQDPLLGNLWFINSQVNCTSAFLQTVCQ
jgi:hypothetical protein